MTRPLALLAAILLALPAAAQDNRQYASSFKRDSRLSDNAYNYSSALDSNVNTVWQTDPEQDNATQWMEIDVPTSTVDKIAAVIGWDKDDETFKDYARLKRINVEIFDKISSTERKMVGSGEVSFEDKRGWQILDLPDAKIGELGGVVRVNVKEAYKGVDYSNIAVSEIRVHLLEFPAETVALVNTPAAQDEAKNDASNAVDGSDKTFFVAQGKDTEIVLEAPGYGVSSVVITPGPKTHARPKTVVIRSNVLDQEVTHELAQDAKAPYSLLIPIVKGYTGGAWGEITVKVTDTWPGSVAENPLALTELRMTATTIEEF
ncbi:MAG: hypothetical protein H6737_29110 [Alphaproteobacteria bacterium]|nr:hypothetical protein [Alphaproteobacteria bacterium]